MSPATNVHADPNRYAFVPGANPLPTIVGGSGCFVHTADGRRILDGAAGAIVGNIGWGRAEVGEAAGRAMSECGYVIPLWPTPHRLELHDRLVDRWLPDGFTNVFFTSGGSESTDSALRLARAYQLGHGRSDRWKIIGRHPSYHGMTLGTMSVASHSTRSAGYEPLLLPFPKVPWDDPEMVVKVFEQEDPATIAGFIAEPITGAAGACLTASDEYWRVVTELCREHDVLLIADEVMTGYGRTGRTFGHQHFPFEPDVIVGGKGLGGGYVPLGAVATTARVADVLRSSGFMYFTFTGNDGACAAANVVLDIMEREQLVDRCATHRPGAGRSAPRRARQPPPGQRHPRTRPVLRPPARVQPRRRRRRRARARPVGVSRRVGPGAERRDGGPAVHRQRGRDRSARHHPARRARPRRRRA